MCPPSHRGDRKRVRKRGLNLWHRKDLLAPTPSVRQPLFETSDTRGERTWADRFTRTKVQNWIPLFYLGKTARIQKKEGFIRAPPNRYGPSSSSLILSLGKPNAPSIFDTSWKVFEGFLKAFWRTGTRTLQKPFRDLLGTAGGSVAGMKVLNQSMFFFLISLFFVVCCCFGDLPCLFVWFSSLCRGFCGVLRRENPCVFGGLSCYLSKKSNGWRVRTSKENLGQKKNRVFLSAVPQRLKEKGKNAQKCKSGTKKRELLEGGFCKMDASLRCGA